MNESPSIYLADHTEKNMKVRNALMVIAVALTGCSQSASEQVEGQSAETLPAVTTNPADVQKPATSPLLIDGAQVKLQEPSVLAGATWTTKQCSLTTPDDGKDLSAQANSPTRLEGFFIDPQDAPAGEFEIVLKGDGANYGIPAKTGWERADVATFFKVPALATAGYDVLVTLDSSVPKGEYDVDLMLERGGVKYFCESGKRLLVK